jgi:hypothetical protein
MLSFYQIPNTINATKVLQHPGPPQNISRENWTRKSSPCRIFTRLKPKKTSIHIKGVRTDFLAKGKAND